MQVAINLTPVLVTLIICVFLYAMCKIARQDEKKKRQEIEVPEFMSGKRTYAEREPRTQVQDIREYVEGRLQEGEKRQ